MRLCIDATNIRDGGGITHLRELLNALESTTHPYDHVVVWGGREVCAALPKKKWLTVQTDPLLNKTLLHRMVWCIFKLPRYLKPKTDVLFVLGGYALRHHAPTVLICQNLLPFEPTEFKRYAQWRKRLKYVVLRWLQVRSLTRCDGAIYLTPYAKNQIQRWVKKNKAIPSAVIPHGVNADLFHKKTTQSASPAHTFRLVYVSRIDPYKHHDKVIEAVALARAAGLPITLDVVGFGEARFIRQLESDMAWHDPQGAFVRFVGALPYDAMQTVYAQYDALVFASSCETFGQIILEAMACELPVICSNLSAMPDVAGDAALFINPLDAHDICEKITFLYAHHDFQAHLKQKGVLHSQRFSWARCAEQTVSFLKKIQVS